MKKINNHYVLSIPFGIEFMLTLLYYSRKVHSYLRVSRKKQSLRRFIKLSSYCRNCSLRIIPSVCQEVIIYIKWIGKHSDLVYTLHRQEIYDSKIFYIRILWLDYKYNFNNYNYSYLQFLR